VFGGSYGWASAGRFHHAQSQLHRFLNCLGGYVRSVNTYSYGTSQVLLPHVVGDVALIMAGATAWPVIAEHTDLLVAFGGLSPKNSAVASGGIGRHTMGQALTAAVARGCRLVSVSPLRTDTDISLGAEWIAPVPVPPPPGPRPAARGVRQAADRGAARPVLDRHRAARGHRPALDDVGRTRRYRRWQRRLHPVRHAAADRTVRASA
jgi:hypothetical protein